MLRSRNQRAFVGAAILLVSSVPIGDAHGATTKKPTTKRAAPAFRLSTDDASIIVGRNSATVVTISANRRAGFPGAIRLSASSPRKGLTVAFDENPLLADDTDITVIAQPTTVLGKTRITLTAANGNVASRLVISVTVSSKVPDYGIPIPGSPTTTGPGTPTIVTATSVSPAVTPPTTIAALAPSTSTPTTPGASTTTGVSTTIASTTTSTTTTSTTLASTTTTGRPASSGELIIKRSVTTQPVCDPLALSTANLALTINNTGTSIRTYAIVTPQACTETAKISVAPGAVTSRFVPANALIVVRSTSTGTPIRKVFRVAAGSTILNVGAAVTYTAVCRSVGPSASFSLADGEQYVLTNIPRSECTVTEDNGDNPRQLTDNWGAPNDGIVIVQGRPAGCGDPTVSTPVGTGNGCYGEVVAIY